MKKENYLDRVPKRAAGIAFFADENGIVTLEIENKGAVNYIFQKLLKKPKISYVHLDEMGSFIWYKINGRSSVFEIGDFIKNRFGENAEPLYERLSKYFEILKSYNFIEWNM